MWCCPDLNFPTTAYDFLYFHVMLDKITFSTFYVSNINASFLRMTCFSTGKNKVLSGQHELDVGEQ